MKLFHTTAVVPALAAGLVLLSAADSFALEVKSATSAGTGCKADQGITATGTDQSIIIDFPELNTETFEGKKLARSNCNASINVTDSSGRKFRPVKVLLNPEVNVGNADDLALRFNTWFQGSRETGSVEVKLKAAAKTAKALEILPDIWSPCSKDVTLNAGVALVAKSKTGLTKDIKVAFKDGVKIELEWKPCNTK